MDLQAACAVVVSATPGERPHSAPSPSMTGEILYCFFLLALALLLFALERIPVDVATIALLAALVLPGILTPAEAFAGFGNEAIVILGGIFVMSGAIQQTHALDPLAGWLLRRAGARERRLTTATLSLAGAVSAFLNNTTVAALFAPQAAILARRAGFSPSRLLLPLAFATILGGTCTLVGTSTNVAVSGFLAKQGFEPLGLFEATPVALACCAVGFAYLVFAAPRFLTNASAPRSREFEVAFHEISDGDVVPVSGTPHPGNEKATRKNQILAPTIFILSIGLGASGLLPLSGTVLAGAAAVILLRCISPEQARAFVDWRLLVLIGGMTAFGTALAQTGASAWLAQRIVDLLLPWGALAVLGGFLVLTVVLTQPMSNAAAALVVLPVALEAAALCGSDPRAFGIGIMLAASLSFLTPFEPACLLVYGAGNYRFLDFLKVGTPLTLILLAIILIVLPVFFPLSPHHP